MRSRLRLFLTLAALSLIAGLAVSWIVGSAMVQGHPSDVSAAEPPARDFELRSAGGVVLAATYRPGARRDSPAVLLLHGVRASRAVTDPAARWLSSLGYATLTIDFRGHGESTMRRRSFGLDESADARAAFAWLKRRQRGARVAVIGSSLGGAASLLGREGPLPADALVLQAVYPDIRSAIRNRIAARLTAAPAYLLEPLLSLQSKPRFGVWPWELSPRQALRRYRGPVLVIGGAEDRYTPPEETRALYAAAPGPKALWLVPHGGHAELGNLGHPATREQVRRFLHHTIGPP